MTTINNFFTPQKAVKKGEAQLSIFYTNDMHGDINRLSKLKTAKDTFERQNKDNATLTLTAGDCFYGKDKKRIGLISKVMNWMKFDALTLGNHEFTPGSKGLAENLKQLDATAVSANLEIGEDSALNESVADKKLVKSAVFMKGGHKFAVIGASPFDAEVGITEDAKSGVRVMDVDKTIAAINEEAKNLEKQGINKIILLSHLGYGEHADLRVARETEGIDIIVGGHSHAVVDGVNAQEGEGDHKLNLVKSKRGENVVITQAGKLNEYAGFLDVVFDENGVIKTDSIKNKLAHVSDFAEDADVNELMVETLGEKQHLANVKHGYDPECEFEERYTENPVHNVLADAVLAKGKKQGVQAVLFATNTVKGGATGEITNYNLKYEMLPYNSKYVAAEMSEKDVVALLNATSSKVFGEVDPPLLRCAGMKYTVDQAAGKAPLTELQLTDENGNVTATIDTKNPSADKKVKVAFDTYLFAADYSKEILAKYKDEAQEVGEQQEIFTSYLEEKGEIDLAKSSDKRITIKYNDLASFCPQYSMDDKVKTLKNA
ncbi:metallophosphoesterase [bacterium]|nr:metallophosphoesterase [bacterium]